MAESRLAREQVEALYRQHADGVFRFLLGVLKDPDLSDEALQQTFVQVLERGHTADTDTMKGWIYKVAFHQGIALRRRQRLGDRVVRDMALDPDVLRAAIALQRRGTATDQRVIEVETLRQAESAVDELPAEQREVLRMRISEAKTFQQIAEHLGVPLGTALTRMRLALEKLRRKLQS